MTRVCKIQAETQEQGEHLKKYIARFKNIDASDACIEIKSNLDTVLSIPTLSVERDGHYHTIESHYLGIWLTFFEEK